MEDKDNSGSSDEIDVVDGKPAIKAEVWSPGSLVLVKEEVIDPADVQTCDLAVKKEDPFLTAPEDPHTKLLKAQESLKQENPEYCVDSKQTWNPTTKSLTEDPFPVTLYRVNTALGMDQPLEINSSTLHNPDRQLNVPLPMPQLYDDDSFDSFNTTFCTDNPVNPTKLEKTHNGDKRHSCSLCPYASVWKSSLDVHMRTHTKPYKCSLCLYSSAEERDLKMHMITHTGDRPYKCSSCPFTFAHINSMKRHIRTHTGDKPYKCSLCSYSCAEKCSLKVHMVTHTGVKPYICSLCPYSCARSQNLKSHMRFHTGDKPYKCSSCSYSCAGKSNLNRHERTHTI